MQHQLIPSTPFLLTKPTVYTQIPVNAHFIQHLLTSTICQAYAGDKDRKESEYNPWLSKYNLVVWSNEKVYIIAIFTEGI